MSKHTLSSPSYLLLLIFLLFSATLFAQSPSGFQKKGSWGKKAKMKVKLSGKIMDAETGDALEYANVVVLHPDSSFVAGIASNERGRFELMVVPGPYLLKVDFLAYQTQFSPQIFVKPDEAFKDIGTINLQSKSEMLEGFEIREERSQMEFAIDKKVFNVGKDLANIGGTASDVLESVPSVTVDADGTVNLRGNNDVRILIDGKLSGLLGINSVNALEQLPSNLIQKIEVITNPSAREDAQGVAGIINIVLKKDRKKGWNGTFDVGTGWPQDHNMSINMNYRTQKFNLFTNLGGRFRQTYGHAFTYRETLLNDTLFILDSQEETERRGLSANIRFGADFFINDRNTLTTSILYRIGKQDNIADVLNGNLNNVEGFTSGTVRLTEEVENEDNIDYTLNYKRLFSRKGQEFTASFLYSKGGEDEEMIAFEQMASDASFTPIGNRTTTDQTNNEEFEERYIIEADYIQPLGKGSKFEMGYRSTLREISNNFRIKAFDESSGMFVSDFLVDEEFVYNENIHAFYAQFGSKSKKWDYQLGLRTEISDISTDFREAVDNGTQKNYTDLFPSAFLTYKIKQGTSLQWSYSRRIRRPRFWFLNPFWTNQNPVVARSGNADLDPAYTHSAEMGFLQFWEGVSLNSSVYYRHTTGEIEFNSVLIDSVLSRRPVNIDSRDDVGYELSLTANPFKWWKLNGNINVYASWKDGESLGFGKQQFFAWSSRLNTTLTFWKNLDLQITFNYRAPENTIQGVRQARYFADLALSKDILRGNGTLSFKVRDLFNSRLRQSEEQFGNTFVDSEFQWRTRQAVLNFSYRLNQKKKRGRRGGGFDGGGEM